MEYKIGDKYICIKKCGVELGTLAKIKEIDLADNTVKLEDDKRKYAWADINGGNNMDAKLEDYFKKVEEPKYTATISLEELLKQEPLFYTIPTLQKKEKTTMDKFDKYLKELGVKSLIKKVNKENHWFCYAYPRKRKKDNGELMQFHEQFKEWVKGITDTGELPNSMCFDDYYVLCKDHYLEEFRAIWKEANDKADKEIEDKRLAQQEKEYKEDRRKVYKELKKEFGKGEK